MHDRFSSWPKHACDIAYFPHSISSLTRINITDINIASFVACCPATASTLSSTTAAHPRLPATLEMAIPPPSFFALGYDNFEELLSDANDHAKLHGYAIAVRRLTNLALKTHKTPQRQRPTRPESLPDPSHCRVGGNPSGATNVVLEAS